MNGQFRIFADWDDSPDIREAKQVFYAWDESKGPPVKFPGIQPVNSSQILGRTVIGYTAIAGKLVLTLK